mgnify:CR=1 FL=1
MQKIRQQKKKQNAQLIGGSQQPSQQKPKKQIIIDIHHVYSLSLGMLQRYYARWKRD